MATEREVIVVDPNAQARKQYLEEMKEYEKNPIDRSAKPGGYFLNADGSGAHDAGGRPVPLRAQDKEHAEDLARTTKARFTNQAEAEAVPADSPEEVAARGGGQLPGQPFTPPAIEPGQVMGQDGSVNQADDKKKASRKKD